MCVASYKSSKIQKTSTVVSFQLLSSEFLCSQHSMSFLSQHFEFSQHLFFSQSDAIMEQEHCCENVPNSRSSHLDIHKRARISSISNIFPGFEAGLVSGNNGEENLGYLWYDTNCCQKASFLSSVSHQAVTISTLLVLQASILTVHSGPSSTPWPEVIKT